MNTAETVEGCRPTSNVLLSIETPGSQYSDNDRRQAVALYMEHGKGSIVSRLTGIPEATLCMWRKQEWWDDLAAEIGSLVEDSTRAQLRGLIAKSLDKTMESLEHGDEVMTRDGPVRLAVKAKDAMLIGAMAYDKLRLSMNLPGRITGTDRVDALADQLAKLSSQVNAKVVSSQ